MQKIHGAYAEVKGKRKLSNSWKLQHIISGFYGNQIQPHFPSDLANRRSSTGAELSASLAYTDGFILQLGTKYS
jgi:hypothetical protein